MERDVQTSSAFREEQTLGEDQKQRGLDRYRNDLADAHRELHEEQHKPLGLFDDMLNLLCWIETPEERLHKNRLAKITIGEVGSHDAPALKVRGLAKRVLLALAKAK